jgi:hypothetical protein
MKLRNLTTLLTLLPALAFADLGDTRDSLHQWPADWTVSHRYDDNGKATRATYSKLDGSTFSDSEIAEILRRNGMPTQVWRYYHAKDGSLEVDDAQPEGPGTVLRFETGDLGVRTVEVEGSN